MFSLSVRRALVPWNKKWDIVGISQNIAASLSKLYLWHSYLSPAGAGGVVLQTDVSYKKLFESQNLFDVSVRLLEGS